MRTFLQILIGMILAFIAGRLTDTLLGQILLSVVFITVAVVIQSLWRQYRGS